ncbi:MAG TPA: oligosaccharide flippase family protein [Candidatus Binatia bacterium]|nr:oligosaccharide flippase family protein [Candidatus Binatia bacterium]
MTKPSAEPLTLFERVSASVYWNTLLLPVVVVCTTLTSVLVRRRFGLASGSYDVLLGLVNTILFYSSFGIPSSLAKTLPEREIAFGRLAVERVLRRACWARFTILAVFIAALNFFAQWIADRLHLGPGGIVYLRLLGALVAARAGTDLLTCILYAFLAQRQVNLLIMCQSLLDPTFIAIALGLGYGIGGVVIALSASTATVALAGSLSAARVIRRLPLSPQPRASAGPVSAAWKFSLFDYMLELWRYFGGPDFARTALAAVLPHRGLVAIFAVGFYLAFMVVNLVASIFRGVYRPMFTRLRAEHRPADLERAFLAVSKTQLALLVPAAVGLAIMAADYVPLLYGSTFGPAVAVTRILIVLLVTETAFNQALMILMVDERYATVVKLVAIQGVAAPLVVIVGKSAGVEMAALVLGLGRAATTVAAYLVCRRLYGLPYPWAFAGKLLTASVGMGAVLIIGRAVWPTSIAEAITLTVVGAIVFAIGVRLTGVVGVEEIALLRRVNLPGGRWVLVLFGDRAAGR